MKVIIAGGRDFLNRLALEEFIVSLYEQNQLDESIEIVSGMARGADALAVTLSKAYDIPLHEFPADWDTYGKSAGYRRNAEMAVFADKLIACWDGESRGTKHMIDSMEKLGKPVHILKYHKG